MNNTNEISYSISKSGVCVLSYSFSKECTRILNNESNSKEFYDHLLGLFTQTVRRLSLRYYKLKNVDELAEEFFQDFYEKLKKLCKYVLENLDQIYSLDAYVTQSVTNFVTRKLKSFIKEKEKTTSIDRKIDESGDDETEFIEIIGHEEDDPFIEVIAKDAFECFLKECEKKKTDIKRYICFLLSKDLFDEDKFSDSSWSDANKYKIRERTRKFIREFAEKFSVEEKIMALVLKSFVSEVCEKMNLNS